MKKKVEVNHKFHIKTGDKVMVIAGNHKGKEGVIKQVIREKERAIVEGVNMVTKYFKPTQTNPQGSMEQVEAGIHISNLMLIDPATGQPTRTGRKLDAKGKLKRYSKKTQQFID